MAQQIIEVREANGVDHKEVCRNIHNKTFPNKEAIIRGLELAGLPENKLWNVRIYELNEFIEMVNMGESFDAVAVIESGYITPVTNRLIEF